MVSHCSASSSSSGPRLLHSGHLKGPSVTQRWLSSGQGQRGGPVVGRMLWNNENTHSEQTLWSEQTTPPPPPPGTGLLVIFAFYFLCLIQWWLWHLFRQTFICIIVRSTGLPFFSSLLHCCHSLSWVFFASSLSSLDLVMFCWRWAAGRTWLTSSPLPVAQHNRPHYRCYWGTATKACLMSPCGISWGPYFT